MADTKNKKKDPRLISYVTLRRSVGVLGVAFPIVLLVGSVVCGECNEVQSSISAYYHTNMRNLFVGILSAIALFMFAYKGYEKQDAIAGILAGLFALGVAFFPTSVTELTNCIPRPIDNQIISTLHFASAAGLFLVLSFFSIFLFTKTTEKKPGKMKKRRNRLYRICGIVMLVSIALILSYSICNSRYGCEGLKKIDPVFWLESIALWAFGLSWLTKGRAILADKEKRS